MLAVCRWLLAVRRRLLLERSDAVVEARRAVGEAVRSAREAVGYTLPNLAEKLSTGKLKITPWKLAALEAGCVREGAPLVQSISDALNAWAGDVLRSNRDVRPEVDAMRGELRSARDALRRANQELRDRERRLNVAAQKLKDAAAGAREFSDEMSELERRRMLALKRAREGGNMTQEDLCDDVTKLGARTPEGAVLSVWFVGAYEAPDRKGPRRPPQDYVDAAIEALHAHLETVKDSGPGRTALYALCAADASFLALNAVSPQTERGRSCRSVLGGVLAAAVLVLAAVAVVAVTDRSGHGRTQKPMPAATAKRAPAPGARPVPAAGAATIIHPSEGAYVSSGELVDGTAAGFGGRVLWLVVEPQVYHAYHPQGRVNLLSGARWSGSATFGNQQTPTGVQFALDLIAVSAAGDRAFADYLNGVPRAGRNPYPGLQRLPSGAAVVARVVVTLR